MALASKAEVSIRVYVLNDNNEPIGTALKFVGREAWACRELIKAGERGISSLRSKLQVIEDKTERTAA